MDDDIEITLLENKQQSPSQQSDLNSADATVLYEGNNEPASIALAIEPCDDDAPEDKEPKEEEMAEITKTTTNNKPKGSTELDKFKRRLIRAIARFIRNNQAPTDEIWAELKKQTGCDCKLLWDRMRALTMKKLGRLFAAEDTLRNITQIAQLTVTDWLMYDLVLVHEKVDVIGQEDANPTAKESPEILEDLFAIVVIYNLEFLQGDNLTKAWFEATKDYNGTERQCSPMLLQRRWYQMKAKVREKFYHFWFSYKGDQRHLAAANEFKPTDLEMEIVKHFRYITTQQFATWEELIEQKRVALPEDFERLQLAKRRIFRTETGPDLEVIEPHVETIDLEQDTDSEESRDSTLVFEPKQNVNPGMVKIEKVDEISDDDDVHLLESVQIPLETNKHPESESDLGDSNAMMIDEQIPTVINIEEDISVVDDNHHLKKITTNAQNIGKAELLDKGDGSQDDFEMVMPRIVASTSIANIVNNYDKVIPKISDFIAAIEVEKPVDDAINHQINGILESVAENITNKNVFNVIPSSTLSASVNINTNLLVKNVIDSEIKSLYEKTKYKDDLNRLDSLDAHPSNINIFDGIELEDDGIEYIEEDDDLKEVQLKSFKIENTDDRDCGNIPTIDLKLLLTPLVYTKKLEDMDVFRFIEYNAVKDKRVIENAHIESKPVDRKSVKMEEISQERQTISDRDAFSDSESEHDSEVDLGPEIISSSSWLFRKLKKLSYNPIQLCKNPDFNTRLKRLNAGFYSSARNRCLLKECKPLTIDLHKSFEVKLHNNTMYLTGSMSTENKSDVLDESLYGNTVLHTAMPMEYSINNVMNDILGPAQPSATQLSTKPVTQDSHLVERKKVINLPDIAQIRRLNEKLLTAEVTPIQVANNTKPPVNIVSTQPNIHTLQNITTDVVNKGTESTTSTIPVHDCNGIFSNVSVTSNASSENDKSAGVIKNSGDACNVSLPCNNNFITITNKIKSLESQNNSNKLSKGTLLNRFNNQLFKSVKEPKKPVRLNHVEVSWNPKPKKFLIPQDILLTSDTVERILNVCKGETGVLTKNSKSPSKVNKTLRKQALKQKMKEESSLIKKKVQSKNEISEIYYDNEVTITSEQAPIENVCKDTGDTTIQKLTANVKKKKNIERIVKSNVLSKKIKYCCWAREKVVKLDSKKRSVKRHDCPRPLCNCCCRQVLVDKMFAIRVENEKQCQIEKEKIERAIRNNLSSTKTPPETSTETLQNTSKIYSQLSLKVSVGINTDYDMDFENSFAANLAELNSSSKFFNNESATSINVTYAPNINQANGQTQTLVNLMLLNKNSSSKNNEIFSNGSNSSNVIPIDPMIFENSNSTLSLKGSNLANVIPEKNVKVLDKNNSIFSLKKTNTSKIIQKSSHLLTVSLALNKNSPIVSSSQSSFNNVILKKNILVPDKNNPMYTYSPKILKKPISLTSDSATLGTDKSSVLLQEREEKLDKVLFLTNDKAKNAYSRTPICLGKNKILLCSFEKAHLKEPPKVDDLSSYTNNNDTAQPTAPILALPDGVRIVVLPNKEVALSIDPGIELDSSQFAFLPNFMASIQLQLAENIRKCQVNPSENKDMSADPNNGTLTNCNGSKFQLGDGKIANNNNLNDAFAVSSIEQLKDNSQNVEDANKDKKACDLENSNDLKDTSKLNKKTILSDLMEMSGISAEDTHTTNNGSPTKQKAELYPTPIIERLQSQTTNQHNNKFINNPLFENPTVQTALTRCPELCVVFSYQELKYASENNAQFFKMDIETGVVVPINLVIKKQMSGRQSNQPYELSKFVIDLTDDPDDETINFEEKNTGTFEIEPPAEKQNDRAVPVKLFASTHPSILRRGKSLLVHSVSSNAKRKPLIKRKNMIKVIQVKHKEKQEIDSMASIDLDSDTEQKENDTAFGVNSGEIKSDDDSDSDDEPLAFKAKRIKESNEHTTELLNKTSEKVVDQVKTVDEVSQNTEIVSLNGSEVTEILAENQTADDISKNITDQASVNPNPELEPEEFEPNFDVNVPESSDEDCILGV
ncbi:uncharacterized protein LOC120636882 [Pararge aegeria]|nr:uncharacterized protein LOC120636882 [Pararge aegeria]XP_039764427.1 uncharacterized protein LOC120636882 [Pararge aegeria]